MRMLCCPRRPRFKASKPLPGGTANSRSSRTRFSCVSFRATIAHSVEGHVCRARRLSMPLNKSSVAASAKERITASIITQAVVVCQPSRSTQIPHDSSLARRRQSLPHRNDAVAHTTPATQLHGVPHRRCRQQQTLDGHNTELARRHLCASNQDRRGGKRGNGNGVARCPHKNDPERPISEILLKPQTLVHMSRTHRIRPRRHQAMAHHRDPTTAADASSWYGGRATKQRMLAAGCYRARRA